MFLRERSRLKGGEYQLIKGRKQNGFTIVELLVVIVVIAILAAIVIVSYNGIQANARNAQTSSAVESYEKALEVYMQENGSYPSNSGCLGTDYPGGYCWHLNPGSTVSTALNNALLTVMNSLPMPSNKVFYTSSYNQTGAIFSVNSTTTLDGQPHKYWIAYTMEGGSTKCTVGPVASTSTWPNFFSAAPASGYTETAGSDATLCWVPLPNPG